MRYPPQRSRDYHLRGGGIGSEEAAGDHLALVGVPPASSTSLHGFLELGEEAEDRGWGRDELYPVRFCRSQNGGAQGQGLKAPATATLGSHTRVCASNESTLKFGFCSANR